MASAKGSSASKFLVNKIFMNKDMTEDLVVLAGAGELQGDIGEQPVKMSLVHEPLPLVLNDRTGQLFNAHVWFDGNFSAEGGDFGVNHLHTLGIGRPTLR